MRARVLVPVLALALACGGRGGSAREPTPAASSDAERAYPVLKLIPAPVTYALVAARVSDASKALRELAAAAALIADGEVREVEQWLRGAIGVSPLVSNDLADIGISLERSAALFSRDLYPTLVLPVEDEERMAEFLERRRPERNVTVRRHRGHEVYAWRRDQEDGSSPGGALGWVRTLSWVLVDDWLVVHLAGSRTAKELTWLDDVLTVRPGSGLGAQRDFAAALAAARRHIPESEHTKAAAAPAILGESSERHVRPDIAGLARLERLLAAVRPLLPEKLDPCLSALPGKGGLVFLGAVTRWDGADGMVAVELDPAAAKKLHSAVGDPPPEGYLGFRDGSGFYLGWGTSLAWLVDLRNRSGCELAFPFGERAPAELGGDSVSSYHLAGSDFRLQLSTKRNGRAALYMDLEDRRFAERLLDRIPQRRLVERSRRVHGIDVRSIRVPLLPEVAYLLTDRALTAAVGAGVIEQILGGADVPSSPGTEIGAVGVSPGRLAGLPESLSRLGSFVIGEPESQLRQKAQTLASRLARYEYGRLRLAIDGKSLVLTGGMRLR